ncbi:peptide/nickel transport system permease protein [Quadrisphaera granulorum]|uniref:Peptide/nickel transport system permease protein n=1 Tax=Quadrisphaera granulorum TaxID=317664 RepID=A0A316A941_9ACTN|nr:ABC transporter permease [Quadrisphaera granulorum]PWJ53510.1 peptide/nickel transport system permease protein [Quadrisphaera granulorum]SZE96852.1 peptide/nickel transport system permease protein [Quadrisphaera granulorum]
MSAAPSVARPSLQRAWRTARGGPGVIVAGAALAAIVASAALGPLVAPYDPHQPFVGQPFEPASFEHWLGTDAIGRDVLSRILAGAPGSVLPPFVVAVGATLLGAIVGVTAAWCGRAVDWWLSRVVDVIFAVPGLVLAVLAVAMFGKGLVAPSIALVISSLPLTARLIRVTARVELSKPYVEALHVQGTGRLAVWGRHLAPALAPTLLAQATIGFAYAMLDLAAISYLGLGVQPPSADWGSMIADGQAAILQGHPGQSLAAATLVLATVLSVSVLGAHATTWAEGTDT